MSNPPAPGSFDFDRVYYRVIGTRDGYIYNSGEPEIIAGGAGLVTYRRPYFEFDDLEGIGSWLYLGEQIRRIRVPRDAAVVVNQPMSQGGCYRWSADRIELLDVIDRAALIREMVEADAAPHNLHFSGEELPAGLRLPRRVGCLAFVGCLSCAPLELPREVFWLRVEDSALRIGRYPETLEMLDAVDSLFEDVDGPPAASGPTRVERCTFVRRPR